MSLKDFKVLTFDVVGTLIDFRAACSPTCAPRCPMPA